jgi:hypothetical protein
MRPGALTAMACRLLPRLSNKAIDMDDAPAGIPDVLI